MKRAKRASVNYRESISTISEYTCPHCKSSFIGAGISKHVTRFKCLSCRNEIIVTNYERLTKRA